MQQNLTNIGAGLEEQNRAAETKIRAERCLGEAFLVNPMTLAGHVRGGVAQGIGTALYERYHYDSEGQLLTASFMDYLIPTLHELPEEIVVGHVETPSPFTEYGIKGGGEGGRMGAPPAVASAIEDALRPLGVKIDAVPLTPKHLRALIRDAQARQPIAAE
jgi:CO/xanthine dehydrogenase Mo-binding subunit